MVEIVVSILVLSVASVALAGAMATGYLGYRTLEKDMTALSLATAQMEFTKAKQFRDSGIYDKIILAPRYKEYDLNVEAELVTDRPGNTTLQKITVTVSRNEVEIRTLEDYKANR